MSNIKVISDSLSDIPKELIEKYDIGIVPLTIRLDERDYKDGIDINNKEFYEKLRNSKDTPKTSQATYIQFKSVFEKYINEGKSILYISGSSKATGTYQSAMMAKNELEGDITLFDSLNLCYGCGVQVVKACEMLEQGKTLDEVIYKLEQMRESLYVVFAVDTLEYLRKGGRISATKAMVGSVLSIKPLIDIKNGELENVAQVRGKKNVISKLIELVKEHCGEDFSNKGFAVADGDNKVDVLKLKEAIQQEFNPKELIDIEVGPTIGSHAGPGTIGVGVYDL